MRPEDIETGDIVLYRGEPSEVLDARGGNVVIENDVVGQREVNTVTVSEATEEALEEARGPDDDADVESVDGIGLTYADRLVTEGITTVGDLREAGVEALTDAGMSEGQAENIIDSL